MKGSLALLMLATLAHRVRAKAKTEGHQAYVTPAPTYAKGVARDPSDQLILDPIVANASLTEPENLDGEDEEMEDPQLALARNPLVQIARHVSHGLLEPTHNPPYQCKHEYSIQIIERDPLVIYAKNFLQPGEAEWLISASVPYMARSLVASQENEAMKNKKDQQRTSNSAFLPRSGDTIMECIEQRAADFVGVDKSHVEGLQVVWYQQNQKYDPHFDYFARDSDYFTAYTANGGQRAHTFFVYLSDATYDTDTGERIELEGGFTSFPKLGLAFPPIKGSAVFWTNMAIDGQEDERVLHGGDPVLSGQKMALNIWLRERPYT